MLTLRHAKSPPQTFYTRFGNLFIGLCSAVFVLMLTAALMNWRTYHQAFRDAFDRKEHPVSK